MAKNSVIPVRLDEEWIGRLDRVAERIGSNRASIIRFCTQTFVEHLEKHGQASLPPNWEELMASQDLRRKAGRLSSGRAAAEAEAHRIIDAAEQEARRRDPGAWSGKGPTAAQSHGKPSPKSGAAAASRRRSARPKSDPK